MPSFPFLLARFHKILFHGRYRCNGDIVRCLGDTAKPRPSFDRLTGLDRGWIGILTTIWDARPITHTQIMILVVLSPASSHDQADKPSQSKLDQDKRYVVVSPKLSAVQMTSNEALVFAQPAEATVTPYHDGTTPYVVTRRSDSFSREPNVSVHSFLRNKVKCRSVTMIF